MFEVWKIKGNDEWELVKIFSKRIDASIFITEAMKNEQLPIKSERSRMVVRLAKTAKV